MKTQTTLLLSFSLIVIGVLTRLLPHPPNFTALGAVALFSGAIIANRKYSFLIPFAVLVITDLFLGFHSSMLAVYLSVAGVVFIGQIVSRRLNSISIMVASIASSLLFFLITNLPFWYAGMSLYPLTFEGTLMSYSAAIPFFGNQLVADLLYNFILFGSYFTIHEYFLQKTN